MKRILLLIGMLLCAFAAQTFAQDGVRKNLFCQLHALGDSCISGTKENKFYLNCDKLMIDSSRIYLESDYLGMLSLDGLMCDGIGLYKVGLYDVFMCDGCGTYYTYQPSECDNCGGTSFTRIDQMED